MKFLILGLIILSPYMAFAEYRAYELVIVNEELGTEKSFLSTFDHIQYRGFHTLGQGENIYIENTWMCWGNTSYNKPICAPPLDQEETGQRTNSPSYPES